MTFLHPTVLFALSALAIPIIIHLFNFRRTRRIYFSNTELLKDVKEVTSSKRRLKHYLILACRLLTIFFIVMAFAQPFIPASEQGGFERINMYVDNSFSMLNQVVEGQTQQDLAVSAADEITRLYPEETRFKLISNTFESSSNLYYSQTEMEDRITEISLSPIHRDLESVLRRMSYREKSDIRPLNYIISDFQRSTIGNLEALELDSQQVYYMLPVQSTQTSNVFVDTLYLANPFIREGEDNRIILEMKNTSDEDRNDLLIKLFVNGIQAASTGVDIPAGSGTETSFELNFSLETINACRISFEEFPVSYDNDFYFTLNLTSQVRVLEIKDRPEPTPVEKVYGNQSLYHFSSYQVGNIDFSALDRTDLIVLNQLDEIDPVLLPYLSRFLERDGNILLVPAEDPDLGSYRQLVPQLQGINSSVEERLGLASPDRNNPFFKNIFEESNRDFNMPEASPRVQWIRSGTDLLRFRQGEPFLSRFTNKGSIYLLASPLTDDFTNFHQHAIFVPVMYRIAIQSKSMSEFLYHDIEQEVISITLDSVVRNDIFKLRKDDEELIPEQRVAGNDLIFEIPQNSLSPGFYEIMKENDVLGILSVNADKKESYLECISIAQLEEYFGEQENVLIRPVDNIGSLSKSIKEEQFGMSLWKYCLFLALIFLLAEILLIKFL